MLAKKTSSLINEISPGTPKQFFLDNPSQKTDQLKTNQPLPLTAAQEPNPTKKETILPISKEQMTKILLKTILWY